MFPSHDLRHYCDIMNLPKILTSKAAQRAGIDVGLDFARGQMNARQQKLAFKRNQQEWTRRFQMENAYNHPVQQVARMKQAGLNPAMMYGQGSGGIQGAASPSVEGMQAAEYDLQKYQGYAQYEIMEGQKDVQKAQAESLNQQAALARTQQFINQFKAVESMYDSKLRGIDYKFANDLKEMSLEAMKANIEKTRNETFGLDLDNQFKGASMTSRLYAITLQNKQTVSSINLNEALASKASAEEALTKLQKDYQQIKYDLAKEGIFIEGGLTGMLAGTVGMGKKLLQRYPELKGTLTTEFLKLLF